MNREELFKLLDLEMKEEQYFMSVFQKEVALFWSIISAIVAGTVVGLFKATDSTHYLFLISSPALLLGTSYFMKNALFRSYQRFLECIVTRAKIEQLLGFHKKHKKHKKADSVYWKDEPIILQRYLENRQKFDTSEEFVKYCSKKGIYRVYSRLITVIQIMSFILAIGLAVLTITKT
jgi:hypothetical protein